ncbi:MAG: SMC family ATPase [Dehalococcoidia bacterium]|jgi:exonuclease SbcC|nr:SMC family ATPase [Dehalococcoidia bacterium]MDP7509930.1 SMC family ATPase [Dehalococcoidia bacterium]
MIPLRLSLKNFLCYREDVPSLDFTGIHVACLCGPNGHGKSALLDAITWCLWGRARGKTHDDLISYGADECRVELEFQARDTPYRAVRAHARGGGRRRQGVTDLQLQVLSAGESKPITGNQIRETQARIDQIVGMDYDTFINSAFLLQGRADEFSNKTPADRKAVLAKILGLAAYDRLQARAREWLDESRNASAETEGALGQMRRQVEEIGDPSEELAGIELRLQQVDPQLEERRREVEELVRTVADLERKGAQLDELQRQMEGIRREAVHLESAVAAGRARVDQYQDLLLQADSVRQGAVRLDEARRRFIALEEARQAFDTLVEARQTLTRAIDGARARLEAQGEQLRRRVEVELPDKARAEADLVKELDKTRLRLPALEVEEQALRTRRDDQQTLATRAGEAQSVAERYEAEGRELRAKLELLQRTGHQDAMCPLCQSPLGEDGCGRLSETYRVDIEAKRDLYRQNASKLRELEAERAALERDLPGREQALAQAQREAGVKINDLERAIQESRAAREELDQAKTQLSTTSASLASGDFAADEQGRLAALDLRINTLGYDEAARRQTYTQIQELEPYAAKLRQLSDAETNLPQEQASVTGTEEMLRRRKSEAEQLQEQHRSDEAATAALPQWEARRKEAEAAQKELEGQRQHAIDRRGYLRGQVERLEGLELEMAGISARLSGSQEDQGIYQELVTAFGRQGVQAMLIETVVPRLEEEANGLLGRMTDNRMQVKLETQRERRTGRGDPIETLEIQVSDELGPRSYEMYSGGEAFRVNLALRIALSKVLAQRMGAPMPTLFIDEGFGTQDTAGRERVLDVIGAIQSDFEKIIVITHLEDLKEMFPVTIEVQKGDSGSTFWLS